MAVPKKKIKFLNMNVLGGKLRWQYLRRKLRKLRKT